MSLPHDWRIGHLLINCFYRIDPVLKQRFNELLDKRILDKVLWAMIEDKLFPEWVGDSMSFDPLYGQLDGLRRSLTVATRDFLIGLNGTSFRYYFIDFEKDELAGMANHVGLTDQDVATLSQELNSRLLAADNKSAF
ncbi:MAG: hypothetical protein A2655_03650 [Candidatus Yanofskybacteria bacterium RIFCSPHIGHO2_01_FULL_43_42]|uniref:Uncharacterized protein n=1 Tax=Candidatus Yanofskybacteria bacterium RIFCSPLOWO2_01_FULL_43_22 TaxID=1802695 RepID=A0A1F8GF32_9BACT|nr:MAG: hypothetical protein A2655_03650 [Candidatus Yanofskybacteria bacterium RIFCSPHIGHO2_01_FULL_43_42]OGN12925.1 MAG: hypothetical protein A3D48_03365 [Candidatus Yanofskybacteria bacterium RIFCSPHIGHO2_02_FULL_43_17]OGN23994.1 MAG: hypothetical protein A3A13_02890 [Candidatus Yanofskybacteria bacterium RIFCSPLOWO2_01_FULL_43_22]